jgi:hypothetical protein
MPLLNPGDPFPRLTIDTTDGQALTEATAALVEKHKLTFPVGYGADARAVAELTGAFVNPDPAYLQSTDFVLDPAGNVVVSVYSSGAIGRLVPDDVVGLVRYLREHSAPATA